MIARIWHGWTRPEDSEAYRQLLLTKILPAIHRVVGYRGAYLLHRDGAAEILQARQSVSESDGRANVVGIALEHLPGSVLGVGEPASENQQVGRL